MAMGFVESEVKAALRAADGVSNIAVEVSSFQKIIYPSQRIYIQHTMIYS